MKIVIGGAGAVGIHLASLLSKDNYDCTLIDEHEERFDAIDGDADIMTIVGSPTSIKTLKDADVAHADLFVGVTPHESTNITACVIAHQIGAKKTVARIDNYEYLSETADAFFKTIGVNSLIYPEVLVARDISNGLKQSWVRQRWDFHDGALTMLGIKLHETCKVLGQPLRTLCSPDDPWFIVAIKRGNDVIIPRGNDTLQDRDLVYIMTKEGAMHEVRKLVGKEHYKDVKNVIIIGGGKSSVRTALTAPSSLKLKIIEADEARCEKLNNLLASTEALVIHGDGRDAQLLEEEGLQNTQAFVALTENSETNILACLTAKRHGVNKTIALVENLDYVSMAEELDIGTIINKKTIAASHIFQMMLNADVSNVRSLTLVDADVVEFTAEKNSPVTKKPVKSLGLPEGAAIGGLVRDGVGMLVNGNSQIQMGDVVMVFCNSHVLRKLEKFFKSSFSLFT